MRSSPTRSARPNVLLSLYVYRALTAAGLMLGSNPAIAGELLTPLITVKPTGMGGAYTAIAGDHNAPFTNPAGTTRVKKARGRGSFHHLQAPNLVVGANGDGQRLSGLLSGSGEVDESFATLAKNGAWAAVGISPMAVFQYRSTIITGGFANESVLSIKPSPADATLLEVSTSLDHSPYLNLAWHDRSNLISGAVQMRYTQRNATDMTIPVTLLADKNAVKDAFAANESKSTGLALDAGLMLTFADFWYPTLGIAVFNLPLGCQQDYLNPYSKTRADVCGTVFQGANPDAISAVDPTDLRLGFAISPRMSRNLGIRMAIDYHHIHFASGSDNYGLSQIPISKQLHAGFQIYQGNPLLPAPYALSFGIGQGQVSAGVSANFSGFQIEFTTYGRDISYEESPQEDRRTLISISYSG